MTRMIERGFERVAHYRVALGLVNRLTLLALALLVLAPLVARAASDPEPAGVELERAVADAMNRARREHGLAPLTSDRQLAEVARRHSCDMAKRGFFEHTAPDGATMADRLRAAGIRYRAAGENIARIEGGREHAARAVAGWLKSPGHRENMLSPLFTTTGVGACRAGRAVYVTQIFLRPR